MSRLDDEARFHRINPRAPVGGDCEYLYDRVARLTAENARQRSALIDAKVGLVPALASLGHDYMACTNNDVYMACFVCAGLKSVIDALGAAVAASTGTGEREKPWERVIDWQTDIAEENDQIARGRSAAVAASTGTGDVFGVERSDEADAQLADDMAAIRKAERAAGSTGGEQ